MFFFLFLDSYVSVFICFFVYLFSLVCTLFIVVWSFSFIRDMYFHLVCLLVCLCACLCDQGLKKGQSPSTFVTWQLPKCILYGHNYLTRILKLLSFQNWAMGCQKCFWKVILNWLCLATVSRPVWLFVVWSVYLLLCLFTCSFAC